MNLTATEADGWLRLFQAWITVAGFAEMLEKLEIAHGDYLLTDPRAGFYRDAYAAKEFAALIAADSVRLVAGERPDFQLDLKGAVQAYEVTEADTPGRKRGKEIQDQRRRRAPGQPFVEDFPVEDWFTPKQADIALRTASERKLRPTYDPNSGLVILLNPIEFGVTPGRDRSVNAGRDGGGQAPLLGRMGAMERHGVLHMEQWAEVRRQAERQP